MNETQLLKTLQILTRGLDALADELDAALEEEDLSNAQILLLQFEPELIKTGFGYLPDVEFEISQINGTVLKPLRDFLAAKVA